MRKISLLLIIVIIALSTTSCDMFHKHKWESYLVKFPTCTENGILKNLCIECGDIELSEINPLQHNYVNGVCTECNATPTHQTQLTFIPVPEWSDNYGRWSLNEIYTVVYNLGYKVTYNEFISSIDDISFKKASITDSDVFKMTAICESEGIVLETPLIYSVQRVSPKNPNASVGTLLRADVVDGSLKLTYTSGIELDAGKFKNSYGPSITAIGINHENELVIYYSDNTLVFAGTLAS